MITVTDEQVLGIVRELLAKEVAELRPLVRAEIIKEMEFVTEEEGVTILAIAGKDPIRTFRRLMNDYGVHRIQRAGRVIYKRIGEKSVTAALDKHTVKPAPRKSGSSKDQAPSSRETSSAKLQLVKDAA